MKYGSIKTVCLVILACTVVFSVHGNDRTTDLAAVVLESFSGETAHSWRDGRHTRTYDFSWGASASRFASTSDADGNEVSFPRLAYVDAWPIALYGINRGGDPIKSLGIHGRFDRRGHNWMDIYPVSTGGEPFEIPMPGRVRSIDMWVWGSNLNFVLEAYVRDYRGVVHIIPMGSLAFPGWRNMTASIPHQIRQETRILPTFAQLRFVKFRIWTEPHERVDNFFIYFNQLKILTDNYEVIFDGDELADPDTLNELWANSASVN